MSDAREELTREQMIAPLGPLAAELVSMVKVTCSEDTYHAILSLDASLSVLADHFPHQPILPGVCMVQIALYGGACLLKCPKLELVEVKMAKMVHPITPGDVVDFHGSVTATESQTWQIKTRLTMGDQRVAELSLVARSPASRD